MRISIQKATSFWILTSAVWAGKLVKPCQKCHWRLQLQSAPCLAAHALKWLQKVQLTFTVAAVAKHKLCTAFAWQLCGPKNRITLWVNESMTTNPTSIVTRSAPNCGSSYFICTAIIAINWFVTLGYPHNIYILIMSLPQSDMRLKDFLVACPDNLPQRSNKITRTLRRSLGASTKELTTYIRMIWKARLLGTLSCSAKNAECSGGCARVLGKSCITGHIGQQQPPTKCLCTACHPTLVLFWFGRSERSLNILQVTPMLNIPKAVAR